MNYPLGTVLRLRTTGESVVVIGDALGDEDQVQVRRPVNTPEGVKHLVDVFGLYELDTVEENLRREFNEIQIRQRIVKGEELGAQLVQ